MSLRGKCYFNAGEGVNSPLLWWRLQTATAGGSIFKILRKSLHKAQVTIWGLRYSCSYNLASTVFIIRDCKSSTLVSHTCQSPPCPVYFIRRYSHISQIIYRHFMWTLSSLLNNKNTRRQTLKENIKRKEHAWKQLAKIKNRGYSFKKIQEFLMRSC